MSEQVEPRTFDEALAYAADCRAAYVGLLHEHERTLRELGIQRSFADVFADAWSREYWEA